MKNTNLKTKDLITIGIFTALYFVCVGLGTLLTNLILPGVSSVFIPGIVGLISGPIYMLLCQKVPKFGAISVMGTIMGLFFLISGHFALSFIPYIFCGVLADVLQTIVGKGRSKILQLTSYVVFTFGCTGPVLPLWFMKEAYVASLVNRGKDAAYIQNVFAQITSVTFYICIAATIIGSLVGAMIGVRVIQKHFARKSLA